MIGHCGRLAARHVEVVTSEDLELASMEDQDLLDAMAPKVKNRIAQHRYLAVLGNRLE